MSELIETYKGWRIEWGVYQSTNCYIATKNGKNLFGIFNLFEQTGVVGRYTLADIKDAIDKLEVTHG
jgi:hypothetical protein